MTGIVRDALTIAALLTIIAAVHWHGIRETRRQAIADARTRRQAAELDQAMRLANGCDTPPCSFEDNYRCRAHCLNCTPLSACLGHDKAWAREWQRRLALPDPQRRTS